ncbi:MAG: hypothetical protein CL398_07280, partial [Acidiferrobacteraceae bacterium]|nr:hypothetical protein [Acidiferrobacteraceae bacterium]
MAKEKIPESTRTPPERPDIYGVQTPMVQPYQQNRQAQDQIGRVQGMRAAQAGANRDVAQGDLGHMASARDLYRGIATGETPGAAQGILDQARRGALAGQASGRGGAGLAQMGATRAMGDASMAAIPQIMQERQAALQGYAGVSKDIGELGLGRAKMINEMREMQAGRDDRMRADMEQIAGALISKGMDQETAWMQASAQARINEQNLMTTMYGTDVQSATQRAIAERQEAGLMDDSNWFENMSSGDWWLGENSLAQKGWNKYKEAWGNTPLGAVYKGFKRGIGKAPYGENQSQGQGVEKAPYGDGIEGVARATEKASFGINPPTTSAPPSSFPGAIGAAAQGMPEIPPEAPPEAPLPQAGLTPPAPPPPGQGINPELLKTSAMMESEQRRLRRIQDELSQGGTSSALNYLGQAAGQVPNMVGSMGGGQSGDAARRALGSAIGMGIGNAIPVVGPVAG